jgi:hypothetical protein
MTRNGARSSGELPAWREERRAVGEPGTRSWRRAVGGVVPHPEFVE